MNAKPPSSALSHISPGWKLAAGCRRKRNRRRSGWQFQGFIPTNRISGISIPDARDCVLPFSAPTSSSTFFRPARDLKRGYFRRRAKIRCEKRINAVRRDPAICLCFPGPVFQRSFLLDWRDGEINQGMRDEREPGVVSFPLDRGNLQTEARK